MDVQLNNPIYRIVGAAADRLGVKAYAVGGVVRDYFLQRHCTDIDIVCLGSGIELAQAAALSIDPNIEVAVFKNFGTASFHYRYGGQLWQIEFVGARRESYSRDSRKPIVENGTLEDDQNRRDFTINAMAVSLNTGDFGTLLDPFGGIRDLNEGLLKTPLDPDITFSDDPLRMMRAIRFATQLGFHIDEETFRAIGRNAERIHIVSAERITTELNKIILSPTPSVGFKLLQKCGLLPLIFPELSNLKGVDTVDGHGHKDNFYHTLEVLDNVAKSERRANRFALPSQSDVTEGNVARSQMDANRQPPQNVSPETGLWLRWAALLHDIGKPATKRYDQRLGWTFHGHEVRGSKMVKKIFSKLRLPLDAKMHYVEKLVLLHLRPIILAEDEVTDSAVRRLLFDAGDDIDDLMLLCNADITSKNPEKVRRYMRNFELVKKKLVELEEKDRIRNFQPPVGGEDIMKTFGLQPCREVGIIKDAIKDAILDGVIPNNREAAWQLMLSEAEKLGLKPVS